MPVLLLSSADDNRSQQAAAEWPLAIELLTSKKATSLASPEAEPAAVWPLAESLLLRRFRSLRKSMSSVAGREATD